MGSTTNTEFVKEVQDAILSLCTKRLTFNTAIEIDGIICISPTEPAQDIIVKMHRTVVKPRSVDSTPYWQTDSQMAKMASPAASIQSTCAIDVPLPILHRGRRKAILPPQKNPQCIPPPSAVHNPYTLQHPVPSSDSVEQHQSLDLSCNNRSDDTNQPEFISMGVESDQEFSVLGQKEDQGVREKVSDDSESHPGFHMECTEGESTAADKMGAESDAQSSKDLTEESNESNHEKGDAVKMHVTTTTKMPMATKSKRKPLTVRRIPTELTIERVAPKLLLTTPQRVKKSTSDIPMKYEIVDNNEPPPNEGSSTKSEYHHSAEIVPNYIVQGSIKEEQNNRFIDAVEIDNLNQVGVPNVSMNHGDHLSQRAYRERLREDPERYANTRKRERERQKRSRQQKREELYLPGNEMELERQRCNARMRQRRYREKLKVLKARQSGLAMQKT